MFQTILYSAENGIARITLNRPEKRNALSPELVVELRTAVEQAGRTEGVRVIAVSGAGKDFCSGADLAALQHIAGAGVMENIADAQNIADLFLALRRAPRPVVAVVRGRALAGGCGLATACDLVLAAESAEFGYPEVNIGFVPAMVMALLRRSVSEKAAFELATLGEIVPAARARELGLVHRVFPDAEFEAAAAAYLARLAVKPPGAVALTKELLYHADSLPFEAALHAGVQTNAIARTTDECRDGVRRFLERR